MGSVWLICYKARHTTAPDWSEQQRKPVRLRLKLALSGMPSQNHLSAVRSAEG